MDGIRQIIKALETKFSFIANITAMDGLLQIEQAINQIPLVPGPVGPVGPVGPAGPAYDEINGTGYETISRTIYVNQTGNDLTGNGTALLPYATPERAVQDIKTNINLGIIITIDITGSVNSSQTALLKQLRRLRFFNTASLIFLGHTTDLEGGFTIAPGAQPYIYNVTGAILAGVYYRDFVLMSNNAETSFYPLNSNTPNTINANINITGMNKIVRLNSHINFTEAGEIINFSFELPQASSQSFVFDRIYISNITNIVKIYSSNCILDFVNCILYGNVTVLKSDFNSSFQNCALISDAGTIINSPNHQLKNTVISGNLANTGLTLNQNYLRFQAGIYLSGWATAIKLQACDVIFNQSSTGLIIDTCTTGIEVRNNSHIQFTGNCPIYIVGTITTMIKDGETIDTGEVLVGITSLTGTITNMLSTNLLALGYKNIQKKITFSLPLYPTAGTANLTGGTITVTTKAVTANSVIMLSIQGVGTILGTPYIASRIANTSFVITSTNAIDQYKIGWEIIEQ
jgi:hypothetical protein